MIRIGSVAAVFNCFVAAMVKSWGNSWVVEIVSGLYTSDFGRSSEIWPFHCIEYMFLSFEFLSQGLVTLMLIVSKKKSHGRWTSDFYDIFQCITLKI